MPDFTPHARSFRARSIREREQPSISQRELQTPRRAGRESQIHAQPDLNKDCVRLRGGVARVKSLVRMRQVFDTLDLDKNGNVSHWEFKDKFKELGASGVSKSDYHDICQSFFRVMGMTGGKRESFKFTDVLKVMYHGQNVSKRDIALMDQVSKPSNSLTPSQAREVVDAFRRADTDGNGTVSIAEFKSSLQGTYSQEEVERMFKLADSDESKELDLDEYCRWYARMLGVVNYQHHKQGGAAAGLGQRGAGARL